jgi:hypothetical protein
MPHFQIQLAEQVISDGHPVVHQECLFQASVPAGYRPTHTGHRITCTLSPAQWQTYWEALGPYYQAGEEYAWAIFIHDECCLYCIGFLTEIVPRRLDAESLDITMVLRDSGSRTMPTRHLPAT